MIMAEQTDNLVDAKVEGIPIKASRENIDKLKNTVNTNLAEELAKRDEIIKALLAQEKEKLNAEYAHSGKPAPVGGTSPPLNPPQGYTFKVDTDSEVLGMNPKFANMESLIAEVKKRASDPTSPDYAYAQELYGKMVKKALRQNETYEYKGNFCRWERKGDRIVKGDRKPVFELVKDD